MCSWISKNSRLRTDEELISSQVTGSGKNGFQDDNNFPPVESDGDSTGLVSVLARMGAEGQTGAQRRQERTGARSLPIPVARRRQRARPTDCLHGLLGNVTRICARVVPVFTQILLIALAGCVVQGYNVGVRRSCRVKYMQVCACVCVCVRE